MSNRQTERRSRSSTRREAIAVLVNEIAQSITGTLELERVFELTVSRTRDLLAAEAAVLLLLDEKTGELYVDAASSEAADALQRVRLAPGEGVAGWVAQHAQPVLVGDVTSDPRFRPGFPLGTDFQPRSAVAAPLMADGKVIGVLTALRSSARCPFDVGSLEAICWLAPHVAVAVKNSRTTAALIRSQLELKRANRDLERRVRERTGQIARAKREWEVTFDAIQDAIFLLEGDVVRRANLAFARLVGRPIREVIGRRLSELFEGVPGAKSIALADARGEVTLAGRTYEVSSFQLEEGAADTVVAWRDVTDARAMQQSLQEAERLASVGRLAAGAAHEINNPLGYLKANLGSLRCYFEELQRVVDRVDALECALQSGRAARTTALLEKGIVGPDVRAALDDIPLALEESLEGVRRVVEIVQSLKALASTGICVTCREPLAPIVERACVRAELPPDRVRLELAEAGEVIGDASQLELALSNVFRNALQASPPEAPIRVVAERADGMVIVTVIDQGEGVPAEARARIFEPFFTTRETGAGVGLGLTATWGIVHRHGGWIDVASREDGTRVRIGLPAADA